MTLREAAEAGGYRIPLEDAEAIARALTAAGIDGLEVGYWRPQRWNGARTAETCPPAYVRAMREAAGDALLSVFAHLRDVPEGGFDALADLGVDLVRLGVAATNPRELIRRATELQASGVAFAVNATRVTEQDPDRVLELGRIAEDVGASVFYIADSNGGLYPQRLVGLAQALQDHLSLPLGAHLHDNLSLAFANAVIAMAHGFLWIDGTVAGVGKGGGNLSTERIALHLQVTGGRPFDLARLAALTERWGPSSPADRFWAAVHGELNLNQDRVAALQQRPDPERRRFLAQEFGLSFPPDAEQA
ncbi:MAG: hypothetical protein H6739_23600 [Alphaproteobacteria bacterium]|nr:hypothetical protein [Alphaproteobacteria bacterium]